MTKHISIFIGIIVLGLGIFLFAAGGRSASDDTLTSSPSMSTTTTPVQVTLVTNKGSIILEMFTEQMPNTTENFLSLAAAGFYDGTKFHRVIDGFMIQGGDPTSKGDDASLYGRGGPGYTIPDEFASGLSNIRGTISMANAGPNTGGSQFFISVADNTFLDGKHPVFGKVLEGMDVVDTISHAERNRNDLPLQPIVIEKMVITGR